MTHDSHWLWLRARATDAGRAAAVGGSEAAIQCSFRANCSFS